MSIHSGDPGSFATLDPGRMMGFAACLIGGDELRHGTWKFKASVYGLAYAEFAKCLTTLLKSLPDPLLGIEQLMVVPHEGKDGKMHVDGNQVALSAAWYGIAHTICYSLGCREPIIIPIQTWRSKTHKSVRAPKVDYPEQPHRRTKRVSEFFKSEARIYCERNGWSYESDDEAEALCMLDYMRMEFEPAYAFDKGRAYQQKELAL